MRIAGIDPGVNGGAAMIDIAEGNLFGKQSGKLRVIDIIDLPTIDDDGSFRYIDVIELRKWLRAHHPDEAWVEAVHSMPRDGHVGACNLGDARGAIRSTILLGGIRYRKVDPTRWKRAAGLLKSDDDAARTLARAKWRDARPYLERKKDHNRADALLIAVYGASVSLGQNRVLRWEARHAGSNSAAAR